MPLSRLFSLDSNAILSCSALRSWDMWGTGLRASHGVHEPDGAARVPKSLLFSTQLRASSASHQSSRYHRNNLRFRHVPDLSLWSHTRPNTSSRVHVPPRSWAPCGAPAKEAVRSPHSMISVIYGNDKILPTRTPTICEFGSAR